MNMKKEFIDNIIKDSFENLKVKPDTNWQSFQNNFLNNSIQQTNITNNLTNYTSYSSRISSFFTSKITIISTVILSTVGLTVLFTTKNFELDNSVSKNIVYTDLSEKINSRRHFTEAELEQPKVIDNVEPDNKEFTEEVILSEGVIDTVQVEIKQNVIIKKTIIKKDTVKISDTLKENN
jgi:hypothetical protein